MPSVVISVRLLLVQLTVVRSLQCVCDGELPSGVQCSQRRTCEIDHQTELVSSLAGYPVCVKLVKSGVPIGRYCFKSDTVDNCEELEGSEVCYCNDKDLCNFAARTRMSVASMLGIILFWGGA